MHSSRLILFVAVTVFAVGACSKATPTAPTPTPAAPVVTPVAALPVLTLDSDTGSPVGQAVALTYASRSQEAGKIGVAVTGFNLRNQITPTVSGLTGVEGRLKWDESLLEYDATGAGDLLGGNSGATPCRTNGIEMPGTVPFCISRIDRARVTGSGELFLVRLKLRPGVTSGTSRIELVPFRANEGGPALATFMTSLLLFPYEPGPGGNVIENAYGATITIRPGS
jgi:hypothetical protein